MESGSHRTDSSLKPLLLGIDWATLHAPGDTLILDIARGEVELDEDWDDGSGWLAALAPLRADLLAGDLRLFYLLWLGAVESDGLGHDEIEPMAGRHRAADGCARSIRRIFSALIPILRKLLPIPL